MRIILILMSHKGWLDNDLPEGSLDLNEARTKFKIK